ncbi:peptide chain release factor N(5)-glutamine methyltransferase [Pyramidobacter sp. SM-530-WT-4B]|uniref:peptide chain release factor N(5)-glutamine methyltransferase n=1 Tax=Pyramidobacter porci TaxID=2605789 RepID=A0A6L5YEV0_9BACT|nr:peptide chain release factor N(5)-glutamine methyltransferase [Pyramidobacter porci]MST56538.1 peptide chain release factor N(5)-glutamine methyltransferase [Pyramidobacter porci]
MEYKPGTLGELRALLAAELKELDSPLLEADLILAHYAGKDRAWVHVHLPDAAPAAVAEAALSACARRKAREPLQYVLGCCDFDGLSLLVEAGCLVPRPETELLVECAAANFDGGAFLDWGTGTGCIAVALLNRFPNARALMAEKNPASLRCARRNLEKFGFASRARLIASEAPEDIPDCEVSLVVSNPPYIPSGEIERLMPEVSCYEPRLALDGGPDGLEPYRRLFELCGRVLRPGGFFCVEYGGGAQTEALRALAPKTFRETVFLRDIAGCDRVMGWRFADALPQ